MSQILTRVGLEKDIPQVLNLVKSLALFEKASHEVLVTETEMLKWGFGSDKVFDFFVAIDPNDFGKVIGMAIYFFKYSSWKGKCVYLDDIYVHRDFRGKGIGQRLFDDVLNVSEINGLRKMEWQVLNWNKDAIRFYERNNAILDNDWINCKIDTHF